MNEKIKSIFINPSSARDYCREPSLYKDYVIMTDGSGCYIRKSTKCDNNLIDAPSQIIPVIYKIIERSKFCAPKLTRKFLKTKKLLKNCVNCHGTKKIHHLCPECSGDCEVDFENQYNQYTIECKSCDGDGNVYQNPEKECMACDKDGKVYNKTAINIHGYWIDEKYIKSFMKDNNLKVDVMKEGVYFKSKNGFGLISLLRM